MGKSNAIKMKENSNVTKQMTTHKTTSHARKSSIVDSSSLKIASSRGVASLLGGILG